MIEWEAAEARMRKYLVKLPTGCWGSSGKAQVQGYPMIRVRVDGQWRMRKFSRVMAALYDLPGEGPHILHHCDNPGCWNPQHLYWGDDADNHRDMVNRGRSTAKMKHPNRKLDERQVAQIRARAKLGESNSSIAKDYPVGTREISRVVSRRRW